VEQAARAAKAPQARKRPVSSRLIGRFPPIQRISNNKG
jgi:hypothetical protein